MNQLLNKKSRKSKKRVPTTEKRIFSSLPAIVSIALGARFAGAL
jgi:hypothetical protein